MNASALDWLQIRDLHFGYSNLLYRGFEVQVRGPATIGVFGRNGTGKSTLLKLLAGLLTPQAGQIQVLGYTPRARAAEYLAQIYLLPEEFHLPDLQPAALVALQGVFYPRFDAALFHNYLQVLEVPAQQRFSQMSLGQKKKATIAFALATLTPVLLMDEPTNGLDIVSRAQFKQLMARPEHAERLVLISTHQAHDLESLLSDVWFIDDGQLRLQASMAALAEQLALGIAATPAELPPAEALLYSEALGAQTAWVAQRRLLPQNLQEQSPRGVQLELVYKALSLQPQAMLAALRPAVAEEQP
ncbi:ATP-binding cassette domain-containing protein [Comamonas sp. J-3]|uniref:ATP-binding cassette domain-containing protein n=1 Tax=Comamonas trifloxystrobinivorans TaxID=3350256 RepID=UPI00372C2FA4